MNRLNLFLLSMACASALTTPGRAANLGATDSDRLIGLIDQRLAALDALVFSAESPGTASFSPLAGKIEWNPDSAYSAAIDAVSSAKISTIKAQTGIQITGQTYYRADGPLGIDDEDEAVSRYTGKIQAEARWYFLQSGLLKRKGRMEEIRLKADVDRLEHESGRADPGIYARRELLRNFSDSILASVILHRVDNLQLLEEAYMQLLNDENLSSDNLLRILDDRAEADRRLSTVATAPTRAASLAAVEAYAVSIDTAAVLNALIDGDLSLRILDAKSRLLECQAGNTTWWSDVRIAPFVRYSHYFRHSMPSSQNIDAGLSFTVPINAEASRQRAAIRAQKALLDCQRDDLTQRAADRVRYIALEADRLNRSIEGECGRAATLRRYLLARRDAYAHRSGEYNRLAALMEFNSYIRSLENIIEMQYRRDCLIVDLQAIVPYVDILSVCSISPIKNR